MAVIERLVGREDGAPMKGERRIDRDAVSVKMAEADGYVMVRRPGCIPYVMSKRKWEALPLSGAIAKLPTP